MNYVSILLLILSVGAHVWLLVSIDPMRETCTGLRDETVLTTVVNALTFFTGACCMWIPCGSFIVVTLSALVTVFASRLTLYVYEVKHICAAEITSAPAGDILTDLSVYDSAVLFSWVALVFFALGVLLAHTKINWSSLNCFDYPKDERRPRRSREPYADSCDGETRVPVGRSSWVRVR